jgi:hypothetical protein
MAATLPWQPSPEGVRERLVQGDNMEQAPPAEEAHTEALTPDSARNFAALVLSVGSSRCDKLSHLAPSNGFSPGTSASVSPWATCEGPAQGAA